MKQYERLMRGAHDGRTREIPREIYELAAEYGIHDQGQAAELYNRARRHAPPDSPEIGYEFRRLLKESQPSRKRIAPTKRTLTAALYGDPNRWAAPKPGVGPGKRTRTQTLKEELAKRKRYLEMRAYFAEAERTGTPIPNEVKFPHYREVMGLVAASKERLADREHQGRRRTSLPPEVQRNMEHAFGLGFGDVEVYTDSDKASGSKHAVTEGREIHFAPGKYAPGTQEGDWLIGHELAHVVQQRGDVASGDSSGDSSGDPSAGNRASAEHAALETEADRAADAAAAGRQAQVQLQARYGQAQAFDGSESRGEESFASGASADAVESREADGGHESESPDASSDENIDENIDVQAEIAAIASEGVGGESAEVPAGGGGSGGGADAGEPAPTAAPAVAQAQPEQALQQLAQSSARPEQIAATLGGVQSSASNSVAQERQALAQAPPQIPVSLPPARAGEQTGEGQGAASSDAGPGAQGGEGANGQAVPRATGEQAGSTMEAQAAPEHAPGGATARGDAASNMTEADAGSPAQAPSVQAAGADIAAMSQTVQAASSATGMDTGVGPAPKVALTGGADPEKVQQNHAALEQKAGAVKANALRELAAPMGEDQIATELTTETFAMPTAGDGAGGGAEAQGPVLKGNAKLDLSARGEAVGIIAAREKGADIQAAMAQAAADMADKRQAHARDEAAMRDELAQDIDGLKAEAAAGQAQARQEAQAQVSEARGAWQAQVEETSAAAKTQADAALRQGMDSINAEKQRADSEAGRHVAEGQAKAESERKQAESEVAAHKQDAKSQEESGGIWGWVKSRAKAFFDGIKQAISAAMEAARAAIKHAIETATKLATAVIDRARQAITAAIQLVGKALTAIADTLLAAFPELRDKFRAKIADLVAKATAAVNKWADKLKAGVKRGLELLGQGLDAGLRLLERGLHAAVDGVAFVVDGALSAAEAVAQALGGFLALVKDVAAGPGQWLSKLGAAVMDGIKNHLWPAFKTAVSEWFQSKVVELLGIGGMVLQILAQGGIDLRQIGKMAWDALKAAIPAALIAILVQKLVSMIVPAAGAVMVIIEGLQAAWGTIQRIVAAMGAFMAFLRAVKGGSAGPQFAQMLALAVVVVLDFVANWLLRKLRRAAAKVGSKLKALAKRLAGRFKGKTRGNWANRKAAKKDGEKDDEKESPAQKQARLRKAIEEVKRLTQRRQPLRLLLRTRLFRIKRRYRLTQLTAKREAGKGNIYNVKAVINPRSEFELFALNDDADDFRATIQELFRTKIRDRDVEFYQIEVIVQEAFNRSLPKGKGYQLQWKHFDDRHVLLLQNSKSDTDPAPVGAAVYQDEYEKGKPGKGGQLVYQNKRTGKDYVKDACGQYVIRFVVRAITGEDKHFIYHGKGQDQGVLPKNDPTYQKKFPNKDRKPRARIPLEHAMGAPLSPYISTTKQEDGDITDSHGNPFDKGRGKIRIDLSYIEPKKIYDTSQRQGQDFWAFSKLGKDIKRQALKDVVRTSEIMIRGRIPPGAIVDHFD